MLHFLAYYIIAFTMTAVLTALVLPFKKIKEKQQEIKLVMRVIPLLAACFIWAIVELAK